MKILFVDDERMILDLAKSMMEEKEDEFELDTVSSPEKGLKKLQKENYDAIVSDYQMPGMDGLEFLEKIREEKSMDLPFIIFTGKGREEVAMKALNLGADRYVQKGGSNENKYNVLASVIKKEVENFRAKKREEEIRKEFKDLFNSINDAVFVNDLEGNFLAVNDTAINRLGYSREEFLSMKTSEVDNGNFSGLSGKKINKVSQGENLVFESVNVTKDGEKIPVEISSTPITYRGEPAVLSVARDIRARKEAERRFKQLYETFSDPVLLMDEEGKIRVVNDAVYKKIGYDKEEVVGSFLSKADFLTESAQEKVSNAYSNGTIIPEKIPENLKFFTQDEKVLSFELVSSNFNGENEENWCIIIAKDITEKQRTKEKLQESIAVYRKLLKSSPDAIILTEAEKGDILEVNKEAEKLFGKSRGKIIGTHLSELHPEGEFEKYKEFFRDGKRVEGEGKHNFEITGIRVLQDSGREVPVILGGTVIEVRDRRLIYCMFKEISELVDEREEVDPIVKKAIMIKNNS